MIQSFAHRLAEDLFEGAASRSTRRFPPSLVSLAQRKLSMLDYASHLDQLLIPPGNRLEALKGNLQGRYSIRINGQWRIVFRWDGQDAHEVQVIDYH